MTNRHALFNLIETFFVAFLVDDNAITDNSKGYKLLVACCFSGSQYQFDAVTVSTWGGQVRTCALVVVQIFSVSNSYDVLYNLVTNFNKGRGISVLADDD